MNLYQIVKRALGVPEVIHPVDLGLAKRWTKQRLVAVFPELRDNPEALEAAYRSLGLDAHPGAGQGGTTLYEVNLPRDPDP
jgi:hypothetical protein